MQVISGVNNSAFFAQSAYSASTASYDVNGYPITSYLPESGVGYNAVNEVSALNGSAIAQYGAEKQFLVHDDTIVSISNSAQYALGVNLSAVAQLLGVDETVLYSGTPAGNNQIQLSESMSSFKYIKIFADNKQYGMHGSMEICSDNLAEYNNFALHISLSRPDNANFSASIGVLAQNIQMNSAFDTLTPLYYHQFFIRPTGTIQTNGDNTGFYSLPYRIYGIGRKQA